jgi:hypothetical protein
MGEPRQVAGRITLHIQELHLEGFEQVDRGQLETAIRQELARLIGEQGIPASFGRDRAIPNVEGSAFTAEPGTGMDRLGRQIAASVYQGLSR